MKRFIILTLCLLLTVGLAAGCGGSNEAGPAGDQNQGEQAAKVVVGATAKPHAEILEVVKPILAQQDVDLQIREFTDYALLNPALNDGEIDANFFQHIPYLDEYNAKNNTDLEVVVKVHNEPMGVYSKEIKDITQVADGASVGIPNDATNGGRALMVLESANLLKLKEGAGVTASEKDIADNPKNLKIQMMDAAMLPRALEDLDLCVINSNYALEANLNPVKDSIVMEPADSPFSNVLVVKAGNENDPTIQKLAKALQSPEVKKFLEDTYQGACVPSF